MKACHCKSREPLRFFSDGTRPPPKMATTLPTNVCPSKWAPRNERGSGNQMKPANVFAGGTVIKRARPSKGVKYGTGDAANTRAAYECDTSEHCVNSAKPALYSKRVVVAEKLAPGLDTQFDDSPIRRSIGCSTNASLPDGRGCEQPAAQQDWVWRSVGT